MRLWKSVGIVCEEFYDLELLKASTSSETFEAFNGDFAAAGNKLDELCSLGVVEFFQDFEEPTNNRRFFRIILINSVLLQIHY